MSYKLESIIRPPNVLVGNDKIDRVKFSKCVGVCIDETLASSQHTDYISKKIVDGVDSYHLIHSLLTTKLLYSLCLTIVTLFGQIRAKLRLGQSYTKII